MIAPSTLVIDVHAFFAFARGLDGVPIHINNGTLNEFLRLTSPDDASRIINRIMQCVDVGLGFESATEVACRGGIRDPRRADQVEVRFIVSLQFQIFQTSSTTERIVSNVEHMIGFEIRKVCLLFSDNCFSRTALPIVAEQYLQGNVFWPRRRTRVSIL